MPPSAVMVTVPATGCVPEVQAAPFESELATAPGVTVSKHESPGLRVAPLQVLLVLLVMLVPEGSPEELTARLVTLTEPVF